MLKVQEIRELIRAVDQSSLEEFKYEHDGTKLVLRKQRDEVQAIQTPVVETTAIQPVNTSPVLEQKEEAVSSAAPSEQAKATASHLHTITSPMVGTFYVAPSPDSAPYVSVGDEVNRETVVCIVEAMKLMNEIEAETKGKIVEVLAENGELVEYGQPLFMVEPK